MNEEEYNNDDNALSRVQTIPFLYLGSRSTSLHVRPRQYLDETEEKMKDLQDHFTCKFVYVFLGEMENYILLVIPHTEWMMFATACLSIYLSIRISVCVCVSARAVDSILKWIAYNLLLTQLLYEP